MSQSPTMSGRLDNDARGPSGKGKNDPPEATVLKQMLDGT